MTFYRETAADPGTTSPSAPRGQQLRQRQPRLHGDDDAEALRRTWYRTRQTILHRHRAAAGLRRDHVNTITGHRQDGHGALRQPGAGGSDQAPDPADLRPKRPTRSTRRTRRKLGKTPQGPWVTIASSTQNASGARTSRCRALTRTASRTSTAPLERARRQTPAVSSGSRRSHRRTPASPRSTSTPTRATRRHPHPLLRGPVHDDGGARRLPECKAVATQSQARP